MKNYIPGFGSSGNNGSINPPALLFLWRAMAKDSILYRISWLYVNTENRTEFIWWRQIAYWTDHKPCKLIYKKLI